MRACREVEEVRVAGALVEPEEHQGRAGHAAHEPGPCRYALGGGDVVRDDLRGTRRGLAELGCAEHAGEMVQVERDAGQAAVQVDAELLPALAEADVDGLGGGVEPPEVGQAVRGAVQAVVQAEAGALRRVGGVLDQPLLVGSGARRSR